MSFLSGITSFISDAGSAISKFAENPIGGMLSLFGGSGAEGLQSIFSGLDNLVQSFGSFAEKFLGSDNALLSKSTMGTVSEYAKKVANTDELAGIAKKAASARQKGISRVSANEIATREVADNNMLQVLAKRQAELYAV